MSIVAITREYLNTVLVRGIGESGAKEVLWPSTPVRTGDTKIGIDWAAKSSNPIAAKFYALADAMQGEIDNKMQPATAGQNPTARRQGIIAGMRADGERLMQVQKALRGLAMGHEQGDIPEAIAFLRTKDLVEKWIFHADYANTSLRSALISFTGCDNPYEGNEEQSAKRKAAQIRELEVAAAGANISSYFPTPKGLAQRVAEAANLFDGCSVLEPSAGCGHLLDAVREEADKRGFKELRINALEISHSLCEVLRAKGYVPDQDDFMTVRPDMFKSGLRDRVIMNPPFENGLDAKHVRHAYNFVKPGGRLVAIVSEHPFFSMDTESRQFRAWLEGIRAQKDAVKDWSQIALWEKLPEGSFKSSDRSTGVHTRLIILDKPKGAAIL